MLLAEGYPKTGMPIIKIKLLAMYKEFNNSVMQRMSAMKSLEEQEKALKFRREKLFAPPLGDPSLVPLVHASFERRCTIGSLKVRHRMFLFIFALLFCPQVLIGGKVPRGYRKRIVPLYPNLSPCRHSAQWEQIMFEFAHYPAFRDEATRIAEELAQEFNTTICDAGEPSQAGGLPSPFI